MKTYVAIFNQHNCKCGPFNDLFDIVEWTKDHFSEATDLNPRILIEFENETSFSVWKRIGENQIEYLGFGYRHQEE